MRTNAVTQMIIKVRYFGKYSLKILKATTLFINILQKQMAINTNDVVLVICSISLNPVYLTRPLYEPVKTNPMMKNIRTEVDFLKKSIKLNLSKSG